MFLEKLSILNFKNIAECTVEFSPNLNCLLGNNGVGKTNVLDAVYYLSIGKSAMNLTDGQCIRHDSDFFMLTGDYMLGTDRRESILCSFKRSGPKLLKRNAKEYDRIAEHVGLLPVVMVSPSDTVLIHEAADERRRFLNGFLSQLDHGYLGSIIRYNQLLAERNKLLKNSQGYNDVLEIIDMQMCEVGTVIHRLRAEFVEMLAPRVTHYYREISQDRESVEIRYKSELDTDGFEQILARNAEKDRIMGHTTGGIHRDDLVMTILDYPIRKYGSQGQQKSMLIALKLAQFDIIAEQRGVRPIMLLDDVFDKLDFLRVERLISLVSGDHFGQIFITDSNKARIESILSNFEIEGLIFDVAQGELHKRT